MTNAIEKLCEFVTEREQTATAAAHRFGMHVSDEGIGEITFTPRDRRFSEGTAGRRIDTQTLNALQLTVANNETVTVGEFRATFGRFERIDPDHYDQPPRFIARYERPNRPLFCNVTFVLAVGFVKSEPTDDLKIKTVTLIPESKAQLQRK